MIRGALQWKKLLRPLAVLAAIIAVGKGCQRLIEGPASEDTEYSCAACLTSSPSVCANSPSHSAEEDEHTAQRYALLALCTPESANSAGKLGKAPVECEFADFGLSGFHNGRYDRDVGNCVTDAGHRECETDPNGKKIFTYKCQSRIVKRSRSYWPVH